jgi:hypothetical protein
LLRSAEVGEHGGELAAEATQGRGKSRNQAQIEAMCPWLASADTGGDIAAAWGADAGVDKTDGHAGVAGRGGGAAGDFQESGGAGSLSDLPVGAAIPLADGRSLQSRTDEVPLGGHAAAGVIVEEEPGGAVPVRAEGRAAGEGEGQRISWGRDMLFLFEMFPEVDPSKLHEQVPQKSLHNIKEPYH